MCVRVAIGAQWRHKHGEITHLYYLWCETDTAGFTPGIEREYQPRGTDCRHRKSSFRRAFYQNAWGEQLQLLSNSIRVQILNTIDLEKTQLPLLT
jgi:hypothetical protein